MSNPFYSVGQYTLCFTLVIGFARAQAADLYVSTSGSDANPGTSARPLQTITYAYSVASAGTTIHVLPGVYSDYTKNWGIRLRQSGTASQQIVLRSEPRGGAVIDGQNAPNRNVGFYIDGDYNVVDGFEIRNCPNGGITIWSNGNRIINNEIHHNGNPASTSTDGRDGVYSDARVSGNYYAANSIHDNGRSGSNLDHGLYLCGQDETVLNNLLFRNAASGLQVAGYTPVGGLKVYNNVMAWNGTSGIILWMALSGVDIKNNIIYENGHAGIGCASATGSGVMVDHNLLYSNGDGDYDWTNGGTTVSYTLGTTISRAPGFVNDSSDGFDAHLSSRSPAIGAGLNLSSVFTTDLDGMLLPKGGTWDLGAYTYGSVAGALPADGLIFPSTTGVITPPFQVVSNTLFQPAFILRPAYISQPAYTSVADGGQAVYLFVITVAGNYVVNALVNAPGTDNNSFFVNIDARPTDPLMIWDIPVTTGLTIQTVSWRGDGTVSSSSPSGLTAQFAPKVFSLSAGLHQLIIRGREANCQLGAIAIAATALAANAEAEVSVSR